MRKKETNTLNELIKLIAESPKSVTELKEITGLGLGVLSYHLSYLRHNGIVNVSKVEVNTKGGKKLYTLKSAKEIMKTLIKKDIEKIKLAIESLNKQLELGNMTKQDYNKFKSEIMEKLK